MSSKKILIIENDLESVEIRMVLLGRKGYDVQTCTPINASNIIYRDFDSVLIADEFGTGKYAGMFTGIRKSLPDAKIIVYTKEETLGAYADEIKEVGAIPV